MFNTTTQQRRTVGDGLLPVIDRCYDLPDEEVLDWILGEPTQFQVSQRCKQHLQQEWNKKQRNPVSLRSFITSRPTAAIESTQPWQRLKVVLHKNIWIFVNFKKFII
jgi:hypothetical protein